MKKYSVGIDYGTLSARAVLIELDSGREIAEREMKYPHAVITDGFFDGITLEKINNTSLLKIEDSEIILN